MPRLPLPSTNERQFLTEALTEHGLRVDGRSLLDSRELSIEFGSSYGCVQVSLGKGKRSAADATRVAVQCSAEIVKPRDERPFEGFLVIQSEISPLAGSNYEGTGRCVSKRVCHVLVVLTVSRRPSEEEVLISRALEKALRRSEVVDRESLCIVAGQKVRFT